jgi:16S rRNA (cytidine1402-2'-O)-methyltransferase
MGTLYLVSTPIGHPDDFTLRALQVLRDVDLIAAEDVRLTRRLLARHGIETLCVPYHEHNKLGQLDDVITALANGDVALVSKAGTPNISDPGFELISSCIVMGFAVVPIPGPSAPIAALSAAGLPSEQFVYLGNLPRRGPERRALLQSVVDLPMTLVGLEEPHRLVDTLTDMLNILGDRRMVLARDLTKPQESFRREMISQTLAYLLAHRPHGEYTLLVAGRPLRAKAKAKARPQADSAVPNVSDVIVEETLPSEAEIANRLRALREQGKSGSAASRQVAREFGINKSLVYQIWISLDLPPDGE